MQMLWLIDILCDVLYIVIENISLALVGWIAYVSTNVCVVSAVSYIDILLQRSECVL